MTAPLTDRPTHATTNLVRQILEEHGPLTDDAIWKHTSLPYNHHGSVVKRRKDTGAVPVGKGKSMSNRTCTIWALPGATS
jgi:hypothetical protein